MDDSLPTDVRAKASKPASGVESKAEKPPTSWVVPVITAAILISAFCIYYFVYVSAQREYLTNRNFRALATLGDQLQTMISVHGSILEFYADLAAPQRHPRQAHRKQQDFKHFLVVRPEDTNLPDDQKTREAQKDYLRYLAPNFTITGEPNAPESRLLAQRRAGRWELVMKAQYEKCPDEKPPKIPAAECNYRGSLDLEALLKPLVGSLPFDEILLVAENGFIVYQNKRTGPEFTTLTNLLQAQPLGAQTESSNKNPVGESASAKDGGKQQHSPPPVTTNRDALWRIKSTNLTDVVLAGTRYKLFLQPVLVDVFSDDPDPDEPAHEWVVCGLKSSAGMQWESLSISYVSVILFTAVFFAISMCAPVLKILFLNHHERLRLRELGLLGLFLVLLTGVFTLSLLQVAEFSWNEDTDVQLRNLGERLSVGVREELREMRDQLTRWCDDLNLQNDLAAATQDKVVIRNADNPDVSTLRGIQKIPGRPEYSYVNNAFWTNDDGRQAVKWSPSDYLTPMIDVSSTAIFTNPKTVYLDGKGPPFSFDSILPPNKLEYLAAIGMSTKDCASEPLPNDIPGDIRNGSAFLTTQPLSLIDPILPFGYGFALVDQNGLVLFHSNKTKNKRENFLQESDWSKPLYSATFGHAAPQALTIKYLGKDHRALVMPIPGLSQSPWSLIVYRDLTPVRTTDLQVMTMSTTLFLWLLAGPVAVMAIWCLVRRPNFAPEWLWPNRARMSVYVYLVYLYILLIVCFLCLGFGGSGEQSVVACAAIPYFALLMTWWCFRLYPSSGEHSDARGSLAAPALVSILSAASFMAVLVFQWEYLKSLTFLLVFAFAAAVPLVSGPRRYLIGWVTHRYPVEPTAEESSGLAQRGLAGYRNCYVLSALLLLLMLGVLLPMALFCASLNVERLLGIKQAQLHLASGLGARLLQAAEQCDRGDLGKGACATFHPNGSAWGKIVFDPLLPGSPKKLQLPVFPHSAKRTGTELYSAWFKALIYDLHHDYNDAAAEMVGVVEDRIDPAAKEFPDWSWANPDPSDRSFITLRWHGIHLLEPEDRVDTGHAGLDESDLVIQSAVQPARRLHVLLRVAVAIGVMFIIGLLFWTMARRLFLFHVAPLRMTGAREVDEALYDGRNIVVLLPPVSDWQLDAPKWTLDLATVPSEAGWAEAMNLDTVPLNAVVEIRHFESSTNNIEIDNQKFILLQRLLAKEQTQLAVVMIVPASAQDYRRMFPAFEVIDLREEPFHWLKQYEGPAQELIWKECGPLAALWPIGAQLAKDIKDQPVQSEDTIASEILERADPYYHLIWKECSKEQKFVLAQLAEDGLPNPTNARPIGQLMRRGLIVKDPQFRIMNESFRRFLRSATTTQLKKEWLYESRRSGWGKLHGAFFTTMIILGVFLLTTQNSLWESSAAYVTTALGALGTLAKMLNMFRGGATTDKAS